MKYPEGLDAGVKDIVCMLIDAGFRTSDSGDGRLEGVKEHMEGTMPFPHVAAFTDRENMISEADRMHALLPEGWYVEASYSTGCGTCVLLAQLHEDGKEIL